MKRRSLVILGVLTLFAMTQPALAEDTIRVGHFPNITHVQGLVAQHLSRTGRRWFEPRLGTDVKIEWYVYNAGPSAMEAILADSIDLTYVGPSPTLNAYAKSGGEEVRIIAGAAAGGAALVVQPDSGLTQPADFRGKTIATPQLGNTQDVACRAWLSNGGLKITQTGGMPLSSPPPIRISFHCSSGRNSTQSGPSNHGCPAWNAKPEVRCWSNSRARASPSWCRA